MTLIRIDVNRACQTNFSFGKAEKQGEELV